MLRLFRACSADVRLGGASGGTEVHHDEPGDRGGLHGYHTCIHDCTIII